MEPTRSDLLDLVYRFYPRGLLQFDRRYVPLGEPFYDDTEEHCRLMTVAARGRRAWPTWKAMLRRLGEQYGVQDDSLHLMSGGIDPAYSGRIWLTNGTTINFHVSLLGPYYGIQLPGVAEAEEEPVARAIAREIEATYPGYQTIPPEIGNEVVPDLDVGPPFGDATIYIRLFSEVWPQVYRNIAPPSGGQADSGASSVSPGARPENAEPQDLSSGSEIFIPTFELSDFKFTTIFEDNGRGPAGGWQEATVLMVFKRLTLPTGIIKWYCRITIGMLIRHSTRAFVSPDTAATISAGVVGSVAGAMDFDLPQGIFCNKFRAGVAAGFSSLHPGLGARVNR